MTRSTYTQGQVGHNVMVARTETLAKEDACEALGGVRVHFAPFQAQQTVGKSTEPLEGLVTSPNGFLSDKDSGIMFYVVRLV